ncbi:MAG: hypothetical protein CMH56_14860 [Myxococcales bacterium]|nr:hypothetical protein [Myxococcales bacterium]
MSHLQLTDDEIALLRYTCDLYFVEESPLFFLESEKRVPEDLTNSYRQLEQKRVVDPSTFQITDPALDQLAPVTECDARVVHLQKRENQDTRLIDYYLLDEIAVKYRNEDTGHLMGVDMDTDELVAFLARRLVPRQSSGDLLLVDLTPLEIIALAQLSAPLRTNPQAPIVTDPERLPALANTHAKEADPKGQDNTFLGVLGVRTLPQNHNPKTDAMPKSHEEVWQLALEGLFAKGLLKRWDNGVKLNTAFKRFVTALHQKERHVFVRYDFGDDEWFIRESTLIPTDGSLYWVGMSDDGLVTIKELDGDRLREVLNTAVGPLAKKHTT